MDYRPPGSLCPWDSPGKNTGVSCHSLLQGIFPTQGSKLGQSALGVDYLPSETLRKPLVAWSPLIYSSQPIPNSLPCLADHFLCKAQRRLWSLLSPPSYMTLVLPPMVLGGGSCHLFLETVINKLFFQDVVSVSVKVPCLITTKSRAHVQTTA